MCRWTRQKSLSDLNVWLRAETARRGQNLQNLDGRLDTLFQYKIYFKF